MNSTSLNFKTILFFTGIFLSASAFLSCVSLEQNKEKQPTQKKEKINNSINVKGKYTMAIPETYTINQGQGDDSKFLQITNENGSITFGYETSVEQDPLDKVANLAILQEKYTEQKIIEQSDEADLVLVYNKTKSKFRNRKGRLYLPEGDEFHHIFNFSLSAEKLDELIEVFSTLTKIK